MVETIPDELVSVIEDLRREVASLSARLATLESAKAAAAEPSPTAAPASPNSEPAPPNPEPAPGVSEEELLAISGALAGYLGVRVRIRQIRLIGSQAWAQQGRVSIQASHRLHT
jgi:methylmalonyl-CoA carboxyltransferase large subunit